jgi:hypothetical protein
MIHTAPDQPYQRPLEHEGGPQLDVIVDPLLGIGRLRAVDRTPHKREELLAHDPGQDPCKHADRYKKDLH